MTVTEFHKARRMFAYVKGTLLLAPEGDERSHSEWLASLVRDPDGVIDSSIRGYFFNNRLVLYKGRDFSESMDLDDARRIFKLLSMMFRINEIGLGAKPDTGQPWAVILLEEVRRSSWLWENADIL